MFDPATAALLRSAPELPGLDPNEIPQLLTSHYAELVSARLRGGDVDNVSDDDEWTLERIADTYELITSVHSDSNVRRSSAFVAATAQQILARRLLDENRDIPRTNISVDHVDPAIAAALLFLAAEQYADANEAAASIKTSQEGQIFEVTILSEHIKDLARGQLNLILERAVRWRKDGHRTDAGLEALAFSALVECLISGIEHLAAETLSEPPPGNIEGRFDSPRQAFEQAQTSSLRSSDFLEEIFLGKLQTSYAGPQHLASLLLAAYERIRNSALSRVGPPNDADKEFWRSWISFRAKQFPYIWPNHREAIEKGFHQTGNSAVMILPTGAGKTTVSSLKIAGVLARGKKVVFLAPTHALVDQLTEDLQEMFPRDLLGAVVSRDFDMLLSADAQVQEIEVMTPERCLAMLSFAPDSFEEVGLLVFDECHLLSPQSGKIRRALDGMLCVLAFNRIVPGADILFMSAMLQNGEEFSHWVGNLTQRECVCVDLLWKPSRQARGVVIYNFDELRDARRNAIQEQMRLDQKAGKRAVGLRASAERELVARPFAIWGLQHNWFAENTDCSLTALSDASFELGGKITTRRRLKLTPNVNEVAAKLAEAASRSGLKTIIFVNQKLHAISTARTISRALNEEVEVSESEKTRWEALEAELGNLRHSILDGPSIAVPHNASMLRLERDLAERMYQRKNGAKVIVATPTLAQGLNLPAQLAILAGDKRSDQDSGENRENLEAHEILNAAARAGRAGHLANGVVLLVPEPIITFDDGPLSDEAVNKLQSILPEDDHCVLVSDPLEVVLDRVMEGKLLDHDVQYTINRMSAIAGTDGFEDPVSIFNLKRSYGAFAATQNAREKEFETKLARFKDIVEAETPEAVDETLLVLASQSGLPVNLLSQLNDRIQRQIGTLPNHIEGWVAWTLDWLGEDETARSLLLHDCKREILASVGKKKGDDLTQEAIIGLAPGVNAWIKGQPLSEIEVILGGNPGDALDTKRVCPRARDLVSTVIPRGLSFVMGLVSHVVEGLNPFDEQEDLSREVVECLGTAVRRGFDTPAKLNFAKDNEHLLSRVTMHKVYLKANPIL